MCLGVDLEGEGLGVWRIRLEREALLIQEHPPPTPVSIPRPRAVLFEGTWSQS